MSHAPDWIRHKPIAHRGLHDAANGVIENSLSAFGAAAERSYAIELDVLPSADGEAMVFHDEALERLTGDKRNLGEVSASELQTLGLAGSHDKIPTLASVLSLVAGRVPLLIEIKSHGIHVGQTEARVAALLSDYKGDSAVQSFNPLSMNWFLRHAPKIPRGQLSMRTTREEAPDLSGIHRFALTHLLANHLSLPDFIGYDATTAGDIAPQIARRLGLPLLAWTVRSAGEWQRLKTYTDNLIFEGFLA